MDLRNESCSPVQPTLSEVLVDVLDLAMVDLVEVVNVMVATALVDMAVAGVTTAVPMWRWQLIITQKADGFHSRTTGR